MPKSKRRKFIVGNWKMNKTPAEAMALARSLRIKVSDVKKTRIGICPPFIDIPAVVDVLKDSSIVVGAQNLSHQAVGAWTGEISAPMLRDAGCMIVIVGHSERRQHFHEEDDRINDKLKMALEYGLEPILCVGETLDQRLADQTAEVIKRQIQGSLAGMTKDQMSRIIIAYEPVWAIGTGKNATVQEAEDVHRFIRGLISEAYGAAVADRLTIQYGGSVKADNAESLLSSYEIDGALVGGASLDADSFAAIIHAADLFC